MNPSKNTITLRLLRILTGTMLAVGTFAIIYVVAPILIPLLLVIGVLAVITVLIRILARRIERMRGQQ